MSNIEQEVQKYLMKASSETEHEEDGNDILYVSLKPRWKWFKPPLSVTIFKRWEISFQWAYEIDKSYLFKDCYPVASAPRNETKHFTVEFQGSTYSSPAIDMAADRIKKQFDTSIFTDANGNEVKLTDDEMNAIIQENLNKLYCKKEEDK